MTTGGATGVAARGGITGVGVDGVGETARGVGGFATTSTAETLRKRFFF